MLTIPDGGGGGGSEDPRVDIWRDRCDRRSRKILGKQCKMLYKFTQKLSNFTHFA